MERRHAKTILTILPQIDKYCETVAKVNHARAINSFNSPLQDTYKLMELIIDKTYKAQILHNLKIKAQRQLEIAPKNIQRAIKLSFLDGKKIAEIAKELGITERTVFRQIDKGLDWFTQVLDNVIAPSMFQRLICDYKWIRSIYEDSLT